MPRQPHKATVCDCGKHAFSPLTRGMVHVFDVEDVHLAEQWRWSCCDGRTWSAVRNDHRNGVKVYFHRALVNPATGLVVDHINGNQADNRKANLRTCTAKENSWNRRRRIDSGSNYKGVFKSRNRWRFALSHSGKVYSGSFESEHEAAVAYNEAAIEAFGPFARLNAINPNGRPATRSAISHPDIQANR